MGAGDQAPKPASGGFPSRSDSISQIPKGVSIKNPRKHVTLSALGHEFAYLGDNDYIHSGYRADYSFMDCVRSLFHYHNETVNVWSHFIGALMFIGFIVHLGIQAASIVPQEGPLLTSVNNESCGLAGPGSPILSHGAHTPTLLQLTASECSESAPFEWSHLIHRVAEAFSGARDSFAEGASHQWDTVNDALHSLKDEIVTLEERVTEDAVTRARSLAKAVRVGLDDLAASSASKADRAFSEVLSMGRRLTAAVEKFSAEKLPAATVNRSAEVPTWPIFVFLLSGTLCLLFSSAFHLFYCVDEEWYSFFARLDYTGIGMLIAGSGVPFVYYGFMCRPMVLRFHLTGCFLVCASAVAINYIPKFKGPDYRTFRAVCFIITGGYGVFPIAHLLSLPGNLDEFHMSLLRGLLVMAAFYVTGAVMYALRIPERFSPGRFDYVLSSHQVFHFFVVAAATYHYSTVTSHYEWRQAHLCPA